jgi:prevent-host-death family protein
MKSYPITDFKAHALSILAGLEDGQEPVVITKRGKAIAKIVPFTDEPGDGGKLLGTILMESDVVGPLGAGLWDATR